MFLSWIRHRCFLKVRLLLIASIAFYVGFIVGYHRVALGRFGMRFIDPIRRFDLLMRFVDSIRSLERSMVLHHVVDTSRLNNCIMSSTPLDSTTRPGGMREAIKFCCIFFIFHAVRKLTNHLCVYIYYQKSKASSRPDRSPASALASSASRAASRPAFSLARVASIDLSSAAYETSG